KHAQCTTAYTIEEANGMQFLCVYRCDPGVGLQWDLPRLDAIGFDGDVLLNLDEQLIAFGRQFAQEKARELIELFQVGVDEGDDLSKKGVGAGVVVQLVAKENPDSPGTLLFSLRNESNSSEGNGQFRRFSGSGGVPSRSGAQLPYHLEQRKAQLAQLRRLTAHFEVPRGCGKYPLLLDHAPAQTGKNRASSPFAVAVRVPDDVELMTRIASGRFEPARGKAR
ncbi:MAG TPA: hypothetical protein VFV38_32355, partial [Ktedonobacteraceae bacterium]|nr:hypothetical protein [Ktedonobacteraceae bacterium]